MGSCSWTVKLDTGFYQSVLHSSFFKMKAFLLLSITLTVISGQQERSEYRHKRSPQDDGQYVHDTTGDFGPYYYYKLRKQAEAAAAKGKTLTDLLLQLLQLLLHKLLLQLLSELSHNQLLQLDLPTSEQFQPHLLQLR